MRMHFFGGKTPEKRMKSHSYTCLVKREMCPKETKGDFLKDAIRFPLSQNLHPHDDVPTHFF